MKRNILIIGVLVMIMALCSCTLERNKTIKIVVMGDAEDFYTDYEKGIQKAVGDFNKEYADKGYTLQCCFQDDLNNSDDSDEYTESLSLIDDVARDYSVTAVIAPMNPDILKSAAYTLNNAKKLCIIPYTYSDDILENNHYYTVLSCAYSGRTVGTIVRRAAATTGANRLTVMTGSDGITKSEVKGFLQSGRNDNISVADCDKIQNIEENAEMNIKAWEVLGVQGCVILSENAPFDLLKDIKAARPDLKIIGNASLDDSTAVGADPELMKAMDGVIMAAGVALDTEADAQDYFRYYQMREEFQEQYGKPMDLWFLQGYNAVRMIADTAVKKETNDPYEIARALRNDGYEGVMQKFHFGEDGSLKDVDLEYCVMDNKGASKMYSLNQKTLTGYAEVVFK